MLVVLNLETSASNARQPLGGCMKLIFSRPVYPEIGEGGDSRAGTPAGVTSKFGIVIPGQFKLNLEITGGEAIARGIQYHDLDRG
jgi:hypothetical protein